MKYKMLLFILVLGIFLFSCEKDKEPEKPDADDNTEVPVPEEPNTSNSFDQNGGTLAWEDFSLEIPEGSFSEAHEISVTEHSQGDFYGSDEAGTFVAVHGIPMNYQKPLSFSFKIDDAIAKETLFMAVGEEVRAISTNDQNTHFWFEEGTTSGGTYRVELEVMDYDENAGEETMTLHLGLVKNYIRYSAKDNFEVYAPSGMEIEAINLTGFLESAYDIIGNNGLGFSYDERTRWPVKVHLNKMPANVYGYFVPSKFGDNYSYLEFNTENASDYEALRTTAGHEFFHLVQNLYDPRYGFTKAVSSSYYFWFQEATAVWIEEKFSAESEYVSGVRGGNQFAPLQGANQSAPADPQGHGYGMSALIKYIAQTYGETYLESMFNYIKSGEEDIIGVFNETLPDPLSAFYPDFIDNYIQGKVYKDLSIANILSNLDGEYTMTTENDTLKYFESDYSGLSAKVYNISPEYDGYEDDSKLILKTKKGTKKIIYKLKGNDLEFLGTALGDYEIPNLAQLQQEQAVIIVAVVHQYYTPIEEKLEVHVNTGTPVMFWETFKVSFDEVHWFYLLEHLPDGNSGPYDNISTTDYTDHSNTGSFEDGVFTVEWDHDHFSDHRTGRAEFHIDLTTNTLTYGELEWETRSTGNYPNENYQIMSFKVANIEAGTLSPYSVTFELNGSDFCNSSKFYDYANEKASGSSSNYTRYTTQDYNCLPETRFFIKLHKQGW